VRKRSGLLVLGKEEHMGLPSASVPRVLIGLIVVAALVVGGTSQQAVEITDALGRVVRFEKPPERLTLAGKGSFMLVDAAYMFSAEARRKITAFAGGAQFSAEWLALLDPTFRHTKSILESQVGPEQIAATKPDAVLLRAVEAAKLGPSVERLGIPVVYVELESMERYPDDLRILGQVFANPTRAAELIAFYRERLERIAQRTQGVGEPARPKVLLFQHNDKGGTVAFEVPAVSWIQTQMAERAGGNPVWKATAQPAGWTIVNFEQIAAWNPDIIFAVDYKGDSRMTAAGLRQDPLWASLTATQNNQIFGFPGDFYNWDQPDPRWILGLSWLATKTHPQLFADVNILNELHAFFGQIYGLESITVQTKVLPMLKGDVP